MQNYNPYGMPETESNLNNQQMEKMFANQPIYPEVFYKLQPYIMMACDHLDSFGSMMPSQDTVDQMSDGIYNEFNRMNPELAEYVRENENKFKDDQSIPVINFFPGPFFGPGFFGRRFRHRGVFRDLIGILLLSELFGRRRRWF